MIILSSKEARQILSGAEEVSLDLGRKLYKVDLKDDSVSFPDGQSVDIKFLKKIAGDNNNVFLIDSNEVLKASFFSDDTNRLYTLRPTATWPALEISGILMHRVKGTDPKAAAEEMIAALSPMSGKVLDTCCGLGYTAILASKSADVTVFEKDQNVLEMCKINPYSQELFTGKRIRFIHGDSLDGITEFPDESFNFVIHDPPSISIAGEMYSDELYSQIFRVLKHNGKLLHYTGEPGSRARGVDLPKSVSGRLKGAGFKKVSYDSKILSVLALKD